MSKGYWIVNNRVDDAEGYEAYKLANAAPLARHGGKFLVRAGQQQAREGDCHSRSVIIEFPTYAAAIACYDDPEYQTAIGIRAKVAEGRFIIVEGVEP